MMAKSPVWCTVVVRQGRTQWRDGAGALTAPLLFLFAGVLALILVAGVGAGLQATVQQDILALVLWLLLFTSLDFDAAEVLAEDAGDGTLDQDFLAAGGSFIAPTFGHLLGQLLFRYVPLALLFAAIWAIGLRSSPPWLLLLGLGPPLLCLRLLSSAVALSARRAFGAGSLLFLSLGAPFLLLAVAGRADVLAGFGLILSAPCLGLVPFVLSLRQRGG